MHSLAHSTVYSLRFCSDRKKKQAPTVRVESGRIAAGASRTSYRPAGGETICPPPPMAVRLAADLRPSADGSAVRTWSSSSPLIFLQNTRCSTHAYYSRRQKFRCRRTACVEQFTGCYQHRSPATDSLGNICKHIYSGLEIAAHCDS